MRFSLIHISLEVGYAWMLLNLAILGYVTLHFCAERAWAALQRRRNTDEAGSAPVFFISPR
jgi:hypothetical protein